MCVQSIARFVSFVHSDSKRYCESGHKTPINGLYTCGDSTFPGIGLPAVGASGFITANTIVPVWDHWNLLNEMEL